MSHDFDPVRFGVTPAAQFTNAERRRLQRGGEIVRHSHGVYLTTQAPDIDPWLRRAAAALEAAGTDAALSRQAAAAAWGLDGFEVGKVPIEVNVPRRHHPRGVGTHRPVRSSGSVLVSGLPVTPLLTTLVELGAGLPQRWATSQRVQLLTSEDLVDFGRGKALVEVDGHLTHDERPVEDRRRWTALTATGYELAVLTYEDIEHAPAQTVQQVRRVLALAGELPLSPSLRARRRPTRRRPG